MHLLAPLAAGMAGAAGGTVDVYARGTTSPLTLYTDFEGTVTTANPATLDANGRVKLYVDQYARCVVKTPGGATVIDFVDGKDANAVELRSASIIGNAYVGGAAAAGNPISVEAAINKLITSFGSTDFNVLLAGVSVTMQAALGALWRARVFDVKQYGALGDGATNDLAAINAAASAANAAGGGIVFFPPGTYVVSNVITTFVTVQFLGSGSGVSTIRTSISTNVFGGTTLPTRVSGLRFTTAAASHTHWVSASAGAGNTVFEDCVFDNATANTTGFGVFRNFSSSTHVYSRCTMGFATSSDRCFVVTGDGAKTVIRDCTIQQNFADGFLALVGGTSVVASISMERCVIDYSQNGGQNNRGIWCDNLSSVVVRGCRAMSDPGGAQSENIFAFVDGANCFFAESENDWSELYANLTPALAATKGPYAAFNSAGAPAYAQRGTWALNRIAPDSPNGATITLYMLSAANHVIRTTSGAGTRTIVCDSTAACDGDRATLSVHNDTGASITYQWGTGFASTGATFAVAANSVRAFSFNYIRERSKWFIASDLAGAETAE